MFLLVVLRYASRARYENEVFEGISKITSHYGVYSFRWVLNTTVKVLNMLPKCSKSFFL